DEAIDRAKAARDLGVDAVFVEAPRSLDELERIGREIEGAVRVANMIEGGRTPLLTPAELSERGFDLIVTPLSALMAATHAVREAFARLRDEGTLADHRERLVDFTEFESVVGTAEHRELERRYSPD
ncbi:MAG: carboxyvinyl-carboxyphosphonate phosphorylmutase, partial [Miltoncostaeaceae bacterium]